MGINVISLFDGMSCGHIAFDKAEIEVENYVASEVKEFAIEHTSVKYPDTIKAGDVTKLHYENGKLYRDCRRWCIGDSSKFNRTRENKKKEIVDDYEINKNNIQIIDGIEYIDVVNLFFENDFDDNNKILADYKDNGLVKNATILTDEELDFYKKTEHFILPNGEIVKWELGEMIFEGNFDVLIGGSPCQDFSIASATNGGKYGLEGSKSRLFFDYLRLKEEIKPTYFFLENVRMKEESKKLLDNFLNTYGFAINSEVCSIQNRPRIYWTNMTNTTPVYDLSNNEINFQNFKLSTLPRLEWALYVKKYPYSYFGYPVGTPENTKGGFEFDDILTSTTRRIGNQIEGTKEDISRMVPFKVENGDQIPDVSFTDEEAYEIANMECNKWARKEIENAWGRQITDREFVEEIHNQLFEAIVKKSPSRDGMRYGKIGMSSCKDITNYHKISCITRKQDRFPNSGLISFGPYCRFITKLEICKGQTVPYKFLSDLSYAEIQDVCGDGWTVDVIASFFKYIKSGEVYNNTLIKIEGENNMDNLANDSNEMSKKEHKKDNIRSTPRGFYKIKTVPICVPDDDDAIKKLRDVLRPWESNYTMEEEKEKECECINKVLNIVKEECGEDMFYKIQYKLYGWNFIKNLNPEEVSLSLKEYIKNEIKNLLKNGIEFNDDLKEQLLWVL